MTVLLLLGCAAGGPAGDDTAVPAGAGRGVVRPGGPVGGCGTPAPEVDVVVVGAGPAGLAAAAEVRAAGGTARILERSGAVGGSATWAGGLMLFSGTDEQREAGVEDDAETLLAEWPDLTGGDPEDPWVRRFATENVGEVHDWLAARGVTWPELFADPSGGALPRIHVVAGGGPGLVVALAEAAGPDVVVFDAEGTGLVRDACGQVVGVDWRDGATGGAHTTLAGAVVVATGGFMRNLDSVREVRPDLGERELRWGSWPGADGNGLAWLVAEGAATENLGAVGFYAHGAPAPEVEGWPEMGVSFAALVPWVDGRGARFVDESTTQSFRTGTLRAGMDAAWILFDQPAADVGIFESGEGGTPRYTFGEVLDGGRVVRGGTLEEVAEGIGADPATLVGEVDAFDAYARGEGTDRLRSGSPAVPVAVPPYYALPLAITVAKGFGGVSVDVDGAVLGTDGAAVPGLYAAGELTGMAGGTLVGDAGFTGSLSAVVLSGRVAGASAVAAAVSRASGGS